MNSGSPQYCQFQLHGWKYLADKQLYYTMGEDVSVEGYYSVETLITNPLIIAFRCHQNHIGL